jgi:putative ABC transport system ATP-binding protein
MAISTDLPEKTTTDASADFANEYAVQVKQVGKKYRQGHGETWVIREVDFNVRRGEFAFLVGPSGSGKSTLLSILGCLLTPDEGEILFNGNSILQLGAAGQTTLRRDHIGFVFQKFQLIRGLSAIENVAVPLTLQRVGTTEAIKRAGDMLKRVGLWEYRNSQPNRMSPGQCQRIAIARAVVGSPQLVRLVTETGAAAVVVTHDARIYEFADQICEMKNGRIENVGKFHQANLPSVVQSVPSEIGIPLCLPTAPYTPFEIGNSV